jgi:20S proteasome subunit alpha 4
LTADELTAVVAEIEKEKEAEQERKKSRLAAAAASRDAMMTGEGGDVVAPTAEEEAGGAGGV